MRIAAEGVDHAAGDERLHDRHKEQEEAATESNRGGAAPARWRLRLRTAARRTCDGHTDREAAEGQRGESGKPAPLIARQRLDSRSPQPRALGNCRECVRIGREVLDLAASADADVAAAPNRRIGPQKRTNDHQRNRAGDDEGAPGANVPHSLTCTDFEQAIRHGERREVREVVPARQRLRNQRRGAAQQRAQTSAGEEAAESEDRERHPLTRQHLDVLVLIEPVRRERKCESGEKRSQRSTCELADEQIYPEARQNNRRQEDDVVCEDDVAGRGDDRQRLQHLRRQMLRVRERQRRRIEDVAVPIIAKRRNVASERTQHLPARPEQNPRVEQRVAQVARNLLGDDRGERPRQREREHEVADRDDRWPAPEVRAGGRHRRIMTRRKAWPRRRSSRRHAGFPSLFWDCGARPPGSPYTRRQRRWRLPCDLPWYGSCRSSARPSCGPPLFLRSRLKPAIPSRSAAR